MRPICMACGTEYPGTQPPEHCPICEDARQYIPVGGQRWTTIATLRQSHANAWRALRSDLFEIRMEPAFAIGHRALLARGAHGNVLWDCLALLDDATVAIIRALGGLNGIAISHPHYYSTMTEWAREFGCPVWIHEADRHWVAFQSDAVRFWSGDRQTLAPDMTLVRLGGHFPGGTVLHWSAGAGTLLSGDILQVTPGRRHVSFMYSYPNYLPLPASTVRAMAARLGGLRYDSVYGSFRHAEIESDGEKAVAASVDRYVDLLEGKFDVDGGGESANI